MEYRFLGRSGLRVGALALGTLTFGRETPEAESHRLLDRFVADGGNLIDTADVYSAGGAEEVLGRWLRGRDRASVVVATKARYPMGKGPNAVGASRAHLLASVEASLRRLGTDYIDFYQLHAWDHVTPLEETLTTLDGLVRAGKVRYLGASNFAGLLADAEGARSLPATGLGAIRRAPAAVQPPLPQHRVGGAAGLPQRGAGHPPWSPLRGGWLSGTYRRGMTGPPPGSRVAAAEEYGWGESWSAYNGERTWHLLDTLHAVAAEAGRAPAQVALNWLLHRPGVTAPIVGARTLAHLETALGSVGWSLDAAHVARLDDASDPGLPYPYDELADAARRR
ncbi:MAG: aldo/keto reductase [Chloroflexia bacterium]